jgi:Arc/MetJ family transcription regulator
VIDLPDDLLERARQLTGIRRKVDVVNSALQALVDQREAYRAVLELKGKVRFRGTSAVLLRQRHGARR